MGQPDDGQEIPPRKQSVTTQLEEHTKELNISSYEGWPQDDTEDQRRRLDDAILAACRYIYHTDCDRTFEGVRNSRERSIQRNIDYIRATNRIIDFNEDLKMHIRKQHQDLERREKMMDRFHKQLEDLANTPSPLPRNMPWQETADMLESENKALARFPDNSPSHRAAREQLVADEEVERTRKILNETSFLANTPSTSSESFDVLDYSSDDDDFSNNGVVDDTEADAIKISKKENDKDEEEEEDNTDGINSFPEII